MLRWLTLVIRSEASPTRARWVTSKARPTQIPGGASKRSAPSAPSTETLVRTCAESYTHRRTSVFAFACLGSGSGIVTCAIPWALTR